MSDNNEKQREQPFPQVYKQCPNCESKRRIVGMVVQELIDSGKANPNLKGWLFAHQSLITDPTRSWLSAPMVQTIYDACYDCGTVYVIEAAVKTAMPGATGQKGPNFGNPNFN